MPLQECIQEYIHKMGKSTDFQTKTIWEGEAGGQLTLIILYKRGNL